MFFLFDQEVFFWRLFEVRTEISNFDDDDLQSDQFISNKTRKCSTKQKKNIKKKTMCEVMLY